MEIRIWIIESNMFLKEPFFPFFVQKHRAERQEGCDIKQITLSTCVPRPPPYLALLGSPPPLSRFSVFSLQVSSSEDSRASRVEAAKGSSLIVWSLPAQELPLE